MTSTEKLVERLRDAVVDEPNYGKALRLSLTPEDVEQAADAIEAKDARIEELEAEVQYWQSQCAERKDQLLSIQYGPGAASARGRE